MTAAEAGNAAISHKAAYMQRTPLSQAFDGGRAAVLAAAVAFGIYGILSKFALNAGVEPLVLLFWRFGLAALILLGLARAVKEPPVQKTSLPALAALGVLYAAMSLTYILTVKNAGVPYAVLLLYAYPAVVAAVERLHGTHLHLPRVVATAMALAGVALLVYAPHGSISAAGALIGLCSALAYGLYIYYGSGTMRNAPAIGGAAAIMASAALVILPFTLSGHHARHSPAAWEWVAAVAIFGTALPVALLGAGMRKTGPGKAALLGTLEPLTAVALAAVVLGEELHPVQYLGALLVAIAAML
jgi:drug/metabolite transporter (DMT)-like permease